MARTIGTSTVLPDLPYSPNLQKLPEVSLINDTLSGYNAKIELGQGLTSQAPRPMPTVSKVPSINVPQTRALSESETIFGAGYGQGIVPNSPRPAPTKVNTPRLDIPVGSMAADFNLQNYSLTGQGLTPQAQYLKPTHTMELYAPPAAPNVSNMTRMKSEQIMPGINAHQPQANLGGDPRFEAEMNTVRPTNPRAMMRAPTINVPVTQQRMALRELPIIPRSTQPRIPNVSKQIGPVKPVRMEAQYVAPPVRNADMGGLLNSTSKVGGFGNSNGRTFGASGALAKGRFKL
tara:strand:+ start:229 stop:1098 length:870 start_codon:yes stop_codon:yes gene_type:complete